MYLVIYKKFGEVVGEMKSSSPELLTIQDRHQDSSRCVKSRPKYCHRIDIVKVSLGWSAQSMRGPKWDRSVDPTTKIRVNCKVFDLKGKYFTIMLRIIEIFCVY